MIRKLITAYLLFSLIFLVMCARATIKEPFSSASTMDEQVSLPILMYHGITDKASRINDYFIYSSTLENDLKYLKANGYKTVGCMDLIDYVSGKDSLPEKPIMITFDDGYCNNYKLADPLLRKYNMKAIVSVIGSSCEEASNTLYRSESSCNMTWYQIKELSDSGHWEIGNHTWDLHRIVNGRKGAAMKNGENKDSYLALLNKDLSKTQTAVKSATGTTPVVFPWPYGFASPEGTDVLKALGIKVTMTCTSGINTIKKGDPNCLFNLKRQLRTPRASIKVLTRT